MRHEALNKLDPGPLQGIYQAILTEYTTSYRKTTFHCRTSAYQNILGEHVASKNHSKQEIKSTKRTEMLSEQERRPHPGMYCILNQIYSVILFINGSVKCLQ